MPRFANAYQDFVNAEEDWVRKTRIKDHVEAMKQRIQELSDKRHFELPGLTLPNWCSCLSRSNQPLSKFWGKTVICFRKPSGKRTGGNTYHLVNQPEYCQTALAL